MGEVEAIACPRCNAHLDITGTMATHPTSETVLCPLAGASWPVGSDPHEQCVCGDYRANHKGGTGACCFNGPGFDLTHAGQDCHRFRTYLEQTNAS